VKTNSKIIYSELKKCFPSDLDLIDSTLFSKEAHHRSSAHMRQPSQHFDAHLKIKVFLDDGQRDVIIGCEARKVAETETSEQGVDFGPQVF